MRLHRLRVQNLRCHRQISVELDAPLVVFDGANGAGKTTLLEAISLACSLKSFRDARNRDLIRRDADGDALIEASLASGGLRRDVSLALSAKGRQLRLDGKRPESLQRWFSLLKCVSFAPEDLAMVRGAPELRRAFVDRACFTLDPTHLDRVRAFRKALDQRNAALKTGATGAELAAWTSGFLQVATKVRVARRRVLDLLAPAMQGHYERFSGGADGPLKVRMQASGGDDLEAALERSKTLERKRRTTQVGPQRDAVRFDLGPLDLRNQGSQGQVRTAALAAKVALLEAAAERTGVRPLLLLDDVGSELDRKRAQALLDTVLELGCQVFVTTTDRALLPLSEKRLCFAVSADSALRSDVAESG